MAVAVVVTVDFYQIGEGTSGALLGQNQANMPGQGQSILAHSVGSAQTMRFADFEAVPGTDGSLTLANVNTALSNAVTALAGASGTPVIPTANLATINGWNKGNP